MICTYQMFLRLLVSLPLPLPLPPLSPSPSVQHPLPGCCRPWLPGSQGKCPWQRCGWPGAGHILLTKWTTATKTMLAQSSCDHTTLTTLRCQAAAPTGIKQYWLKKINCSFTLIYLSKLGFCCGWQVLFTLAVDQCWSGGLILFQKSGSLIVAG